MSDKLKKFINDHEEAFNNTEPSSGLWEKINSRMESGSQNWIRSKWIRYFAFGAGVFVIVLYFVFRNLDKLSSHEVSEVRGDSALSNSGEWVKVSQSRTGEDSKEYDASGSNAQTYSVNKNNSLSPKRDNNENAKHDSVIINAPASIISEKRPEETIITSPNEDEKAGEVIEKKETTPVKDKRTRLIIPDEIEKVNTYSATLYDSSSVCAVVQAYRFPGKIEMDGTGNFTGHRTLTTISCGKIANMHQVNAIWLKGKTEKKIILPVKNGFGNIFLIKSNGTKLMPEAISHYYPGLGVITGYSGKYLNMVFKDKVELILFFKNVEQGDKIVIDGITEVIVNKP